MKLAAAYAAVILCMATVPSAAADVWQKRPDWSVFFSAAGVNGTIVVADERSGARWVLDGKRAARRYVPASTFKIPHTLFALDTGVVHDEFQVFKWDGEVRGIASWNRDQDLRSSMRNSVIWVYQQMARAIGEEAERRYLEKIGYGNADPSDGVDRFWLEGPLRISAFEQVDFLQRLYGNVLPFRLEHQRLVKDLPKREAIARAVLRSIGALPGDGLQQH